VGDALQAKQCRRDRDQGLEQVDTGQAAGLARTLAQRPGHADIVEADPEQEHAERQQQHDGADQIGERTPTRRQALVDEIDAHMRIALQRERRAEQKHQAVQPQRRFLRRD